MSVIFTGRIYETNKSELFNILWWTIFGSCLAIEFNNSDGTQISKFFKWTSLVIFIGSIISSIGGIIKFFYILSGTNYPPVFYFDDKLIIGSSLNPDYNIYSLGLCLGLICGAYLKSFYNSRYLNFIYSIFSLVIASAVFLSGSRRGFIFVIITLIIAYKWKFNKTKKEANYFKMFLGIILFSALIFFFFFSFFDSISETLTNGDLRSESIVRLFTIKSELSSENQRSIRWNYFYQLTQEFSPANYLFGSGFDYLSKFGDKFEGILEDHPHNFFMATFLYGGLLSTVTLLMMIISIITRLIKNGSLIIIFFFFIYLISFSLTSSNTLFSYRIFPIICAISFLTIKSEKSVTR